MPDHRRARILMFCGFSDCESAIYIMACALHQSIQTPKVAISSCRTTATTGTGTECNSIVISYCDFCLMQAKACSMYHAACTQHSTPNTNNHVWLYFAKLSGHYVSEHTTTKKNPQIFRQGVPAVPGLPNEWASSARPACLRLCL